jgi:hypothetical protein
MFPVPRWPRWQRAGLPCHACASLVPISPCHGCTNRLPLLDRQILFIAMIPGQLVPCLSPFLCLLPLLLRLPAGPKRLHKSPSPLAAAAATACWPCLHQHQQPGSLAWTWPILGPAPASAPSLLGPMIHRWGPGREQSSSTRTAWATPAPHGQHPHRMGSTRTGLLSILSGAVKQHPLQQHPRQHQLSTPFAQSALAPRAGLLTRPASPSSTSCCCTSPSAPHAFSVPR